MGGLPSPKNATFDHGTRFKLWWIFTGDIAFTAEAVCWRSGREWWCRVFSGRPCFDTCLMICTLRKSNIAMENGPFEDVFPINKWGYSIAMLVYQRVTYHNKLISMKSKQEFTFYDCCVQKKETPNCNSWKVETKKNKLYNFAGCFGKILSLFPMYCDSTLILPVASPKNPWLF